MCRELDSVERYMKMPSSAYVRTMIEETFVGAVTTPDSGGTCTDACATAHEASAGCPGGRSAHGGQTTRIGEKQSRLRSTGSIAAIHCKKQSKRHARTNE